MNKEIFVAFATQKGGIGKSTVTALAASYLHNVKGYNVAVVTTRSTASTACVSMKRDSSTAAPISRLSRATISAKSGRTPTPSSKAMR